MLRTNHPCALCDLHGHYSHCFPRLDEFRDCLGVIRDYEATRSGTFAPLPVDFGTTSQPKQGNSGRSIVIPPPDVEMMDTIGPILYLSSSLSSSPEKILEVAVRIFIEHFSTEFEVSTSVDPSSTSPPSAIQDDAYVNLIPQVDAPGNVAASCSQSSSRSPISQPDEDTMEAMSTLDYPYT